MEKIETLKDGSKVILKTMSLEDLEKLHCFYRSLPREDRKYLRIDVTDRVSLERKLKSTEPWRDVHLVAYQGDDVVGHGMLELFLEQWRKHHGELRVLATRECRRMGLGMLLMRELYLQAAQRKVEKVVVKMMGPQISAQSIARKLGFHQETVIPDYVVDLDGEAQDLVIMTCRMDDLWNELETFYMDESWVKLR